MVAFADAAGNLRILDRTGRVFSSLVELEEMVPTYAGISNVTRWGGLVAHIEIARALLGSSGTSILSVIGFEMNSVVIRRPSPSSGVSHRAALHNQRH